MSRTGGEEVNKASFPFSADLCSFWDGVLWYVCHMGYIWTNLLVLRVRFNCCYRNCPLVFFSFIFGQAWCEEMEMERMANFVCATKGVFFLFLFYLVLFFFMSKVFFFFYRQSKMGQKNSSSWFFTF